MVVWQLWPDGPERFWRLFQRLPALGGQGTGFAAARSALLSAPGAAESAARPGRRDFLP